MVSYVHSKDKEHGGSEIPVQSDLLAFRLPPVSHLQLVELTFGLIGIQFCWAVQVGYVTKALLQLGMPNRFVSYAWLAGPIAGIIVQPTVGLLSDRCTLRLGRRRPFIIFGTFCAFSCLFLFSYARQIGGKLGDPTEAQVYPRALAVAMLSFWALDFSINAAQGPLRALLADIVPPEQHKMGNACFALATGVGNFAGSILGSLPLSRWLTFFPGDLQALYTIAAIVLACTVAVTVIFSKETALGYEAIPSASTEQSSLHESMQQNPAPDHHIGFFEAARIAPYPFLDVFVVQCFNWFAWFSLFVFGTSWVGKEVFNGDFSSAKGSPKRELYDAGVRSGNLGIGLQALLTIIVAPLLPALIKRTSMQAVYVFASVSLGAALASTMLLHHRWQSWIATGVLTSTGFAWAVTMTVPWSLMSEAVSKVAPQRAGLYFTMFNLSQCFPEVLLSLVAEEIEKLTETQSAVLGAGSLAAFAAALLIIIMRLGKRDQVIDEQTELRENLSA